MPKTTMKSRFHKEALKGEVLRAHAKSQAKFEEAKNQAKVPDGLKEPLKTTIETLMKNHTQFIANQHDNIKQSMQLQDRRNNKGNFNTGEEYYGKVRGDMDALIPGLSINSSARIAEINNAFDAEIRRASGNTTLIRELEEQRTATVSNLEQSVRAMNVLFQEQKKALMDAENAFQEKMKSPGPDAKAALTAFNEMEDVGSENMTEAEQQALQEKDINLRKFYQEKLQNGLKEGGIFSHLSFKDNQLQITPDSKDPDKKNFSFNLSVFARDLNTQAIDALYMPDKDGRMPQDTGIKTMNIPKVWTEAYKQGFFSTFQDPNATFNDAIFNAIRGLMARVTLDGINERIQSREHEKTLRNDEGLRSAMNKVAKELPPDAPLERIKEVLKEKYGYKFPTPKIHEIGDGIPPKGHFQFMNNWAEKDTKKAIAKHENEVVKSMFKEFKLNPNLGSANDQAVNLRGTTPTVATATVTGTPAMRIGGK